jgi:hypothetical protein
VVFVKFYGNSNASTKRLIQDRLRAPQTPYFTLWRGGAPLPSNRMHLTLFGMQNRTSGPYMTAIIRSSFQSRNAAANRGSRSILSSACPVESAMRAVSLKPIGCTWSYLAGKQVHSFVGANKAKLEDALQLQLRAEENPINGANLFQRQVWKAKMVKS